MEFGFKTPGAELILSIKDQTITKNMKSQSDKIAALLNRGRTITPLQALDQFGTFRLAARISDLRKTGMKIQTIPCRTISGKNIAKYKLVTA